MQYQNRIDKVYLVIVIVVFIGELGVAGVLMLMGKESRVISKARGFTGASFKLLTAVNDVRTLQLLRVIVVTAKLFVVRLTE